MDLQALTDGLFEAVTGYIARSLAPLQAKLAEVERREPIYGKDGKDADPAAIAEAVKAAVAEIPKPENGKDGKDSDPAVVAEMVKSAVAEIPRPENGKDGRDADPALISELVNKAVADIPRPENGKDGQDGRDAVQLDILEGIDPFKRYHRGTCAVWRGGLVRAYRNTEPMGEGGDIIKAGWHVILNGVAESTGLEMEDGGRIMKHCLVMTDGRRQETVCKTHVQRYRGIYDPETEYETGDCVTRDGSQWTAMSEPSGIPGQGEYKGWKLSVKRGNHGRDGVKGDKGDRGGEGRAGKDLTQMDGSGRKW